MFRRCTDIARSYIIVSSNEFLAQQIKHTVNKKTKKQKKRETGASDHNRSVEFFWVERERERDEETVEKRRRYAPGRWCTLVPGAPATLFDDHV
jgi:hypothetical protein